jgi:hypothetical protein
LKALNASALPTNCKFAGAPIGGYRISDALKGYGVSDIGERREAREYKAIGYWLLAIGYWRGNKLINEQKYSEKNCNISSTIIDGNGGMGTECDLIAYFKIWLWRIE